MNPRAIASQGLGFGALSVAVLGLLPLAQPPEPPTPEPAPPAARGLAVMQPAVVGPDDPELAQYLAARAEEEELTIILYCISVFSR